MACLRFASRQIEKMTNKNSIRSDESNPLLAVVGEDSADIGAQLQLHSVWAADSLNHLGTETAD